MPEALSRHPLFGLLAETRHQPSISQWQEDSRRVICPPATATGPQKSALPPPVPWTTRREVSPPPVTEPAASVPRTYFRGQSRTSSPADTNTPSFMRYYTIRSNPRSRQGPRDTSIECPRLYTAVTEQDAPPPSSMGAPVRADGVSSLRSTSIHEEATVAAGNSGSLGHPHETWNANLDALMDLIDHPVTSSVHGRFHVDSSTHQPHREGDGQLQEANSNDREVHDAESDSESSSWSATSATARAYRKAFSYSPIKRPPTATHDGEPLPRDVKRHKAKSEGEGSVPERGTRRRHGLLQREQKLTARRKYRLKKKYLAVQVSYQHLVHVRVLIELVSQMEAEMAKMAKELEDVKRKWGWSELVREALKVENEGLKVKMRRSEEDKPIPGQ